MKRDLPRIHGLEQDALTMLQKLYYAVCIGLVDPDLLSYLFSLVASLYQAPDLQQQRAIGRRSPSNVLNQAH